MIHHTLFTNVLRITYMQKKPFASANNLKAYDDMNAPASNIIHKSLTEYEQDTGQHPDFNGCQPLGFRRIGCDIVENVYQNQEQGDQQSHPT